MRQRSREALDVVECPALALTLPEVAVEEIVDLANVLLESDRRFLQYVTEYLQFFLMFLVFAECSLKCLTVRRGRK